MSTSWPARVPNSRRHSSATAPATAGSRSSGSPTWPVGTGRSVRAPPPSKWRLVDARSRHLWASSGFSDQWRTAGAPSRFGDGALRLSGREPGAAQGFLREPPRCSCPTRPDASAPRAARCWPTGLDLALSEADAVEVAHRQTDPPADERDGEPVRARIRERVMRTFATMSPVITTPQTAAWMLQTAPHFAASSHALPPCPPQS